MTLTCELSRADRTDGVWLFNDQEITISEKFQLKVDGYKQSLEIAELTISDSGKYSYRIENVSTSATLNVDGKHQVLDFNVDVKRQSLMLMVKSQIL